MHLLTIAYTYQTINSSKKYKFTNKKITSWRSFIITTFTWLAERSKLIKIQKSHNNDEIPCGAQVLPVLKKFEYGNTESTIL